MNEIITIFCLWLELNFALFRAKVYLEIAWFFQRKVDAIANKYTE